MPEKYVTADQSSQGRLRADAARNRERIVDAACELFQVQGLDAPLEDVALRAGVGIATLYRRFPTRSDLTVAVFIRAVSSYLAVLEDAARADDPWEGVTQAVLGLCELQAGNVALRELVTMHFPDSSELETLMNQGERRLRELVARAQSSGQLRPDVSVLDLVLLLLANAAVIGRTEAHAPETWRHYVALQLEALRSRSDAIPLPPVPSPDELIKALRH